MLGSTAIDGTRARLLALLLIVALLVCHGFFGAFHELTGPASERGEAVASASHAAGGMAGHGGGGDGGAGLPGHLGAGDYAAVIVLLIAGASLFLSRAGWPVLLPAVGGRRAHAPRPPRTSPIFARGADPPFSQVFRL